MFYDYYPSRYPYDHDDFYRALAAQRAHERREAEYRARLQEARQRQQLEEALRHNAYQNHLAREQRRRSMYPYFSGFDSHEEYSDSPSYTYSQPTYELRQKPRSRDIYDSLRRTAEPEPRGKNSFYRRTRSVSPYEHEPLTNLHTSHRSHTPRTSPPPGTTRISIRSPSPEPDMRDQAARKIQAFFRTNMPRYKSLKAISSVAQEFQTVVKNFTFPETLDFGERSDAVELLYTSRNAPVHLYEHTLLNLLSKLDSIDSHGDERVRAARKNLVKEIESELGKLDAEKLAAWEARRTALVTSVTDEKEVPSTELQAELEGSAMEITEEKVNEVDCSSLPEYLSPQLTSNHPEEQPSATQSSEEQTQNEETYQDSIKAQDSNIVLHSDPVASSDLPLDFSDSNTLSTISSDVDSSSGMDIGQPQASETQERCGDEDAAVNHLEAPLNAVAPSDDPVAPTSFPVMPVEVCV